MRRLAGHDFSWAHYDFKPAPGDPLHTLRWPRIVIFERLPVPKGLVILKGVYPDYEKMTAETPVWRRSHRGGQRWHRQGRRMRRSLAALSSAALPAGRPKGTNAMTGSFHIEPWDAPPKS
jgi:hypothetical protein